ncbi:sialidase [Paenibacillus albicereus]|uniref:Sialidase n=1 Tax=Paenibacillus albicereus TaxID=2726185 RepID=A0A6H2GVV2_9BACL|nr:PA14 domain-containing protein [Paenibacillus albicereus]QJC51522.1 sialidase [Paenibacillus albicereus]
MRTMARWKGAAAAVLAAVLLVPVGGGVSQAAASDISSSYAWQTLKTGAGGFVTGIDVHKDGGVVYARTDVGGGYRLNDAKTAWIQVVTAASMPDESPGAMKGVISLVSAPNDSNQAYMAYNGSVYRSWNKGAEWTKTNLSGIVGDANGDGRTTGERLAVDPANNNVVYYGTSGSGLRKTRDGGSTWSSDTSVPSSGETVQGVTSVVFDAGSGTVGSGSSLRTKTVYAAIYNRGVFRSDNGGDSFYKITGSGLGDSGSFSSLKFQSGTLYVVASGLWKYNGSWTNISPSPDTASVAVSPSNPSLLIAIQHGGNIYRSTTGGSQWTQLSRDRTASDVPWLAWTDESWMSVGNLVFDPVAPNRLWFAEGIGVWTTTDIQDSNVTWTSLNAGIEEMVSNDVVAPPGGKPVTAFWDRPLFYHANLDAYPATHQPSARFSSAWDLDYSANNPNFLVATISDHRFCCESDGQAYSSGYSTDGGQSWTPFASQPADMRFGNIAVAASDTQNIVYLPTSNRTPFYTNNRGASWTPIILPGTESSYDSDGKYNGGSHFAYYLNRHVLAADTVNDRTFYLYHADRGFYRSTDGGQSWTLVNTTMPKGWTVGWFNASLKSVPGKAGHLFLTFGSLDESTYSLYRSTDGGASWSEISAVKDATAIGLGKAAPGSSYPTLYVSGYVGGDYGIWRSTNEGADWQKAGTYPLGIYDHVSAIDGDKDVFGKVYVGFKGNSFVYGTSDAGGSGGGGSGTGTGLAGTYWNGLNFEQWVKNVTENIDFDWGSGSPSGANADNFMARWTGKIEPKYSETYTFYTYADDGIRVWVNGQLVIDNWVDQPPTEKSGTITLQAGVKADIRVDYYEKTGSAIAKLSWSSASQAKEIVPASRLYVS